MDKESRSLISPDKHFISLKTPIFLSTCKLDFLFNESKQLNECLKDYKYQSTYVYINSNKKSITHVHNVVRPNLLESKQVNDAAIDFINEIIKK